MIDTLDKIIKTRNLEIGQIIFGEEEFIIGKRKKDIIEVNILSEENFFEKEEVVEFFYSKGKVFQNIRTVKHDLRSINTERRKMLWEVISVEITKDFNGLHGFYLGYTKVKCKSLKTNEIIEFYTKGKKNLINKKFEVIGYKK